MAAAKERPGSVPVSLHQLGHLELLREAKCPLTSKLSTKRKAGVGEGSPWGGDVFPDRGRAGCSTALVLRVLEHVGAHVMGAGSLGAAHGVDLLNEGCPVSGTSPPVVQPAPARNLSCGWDKPPLGPLLSPLGPLTLAAGCGGGGVHPVFHAVSCPGVTRSTGDPRATVCSPTPWTGGAMGAFITFLGCRHPS